MVDTLAKICGQRWPRLLSPVLASAYCGMLRVEFLKHPELLAAKKIIKGREKYDRFELDQIIDQLISDAE